MPNSCCTASKHLPSSSFAACSAVPLTAQAPGYCKPQINPVPWLRDHLAAAAAPCMHRNSAFANLQVNALVYFPRLFFVLAAVSAAAAATVTTVCICNPRETTASAMSDTCPSCEKAIANKGANVKCAECGHKYHFGKCAGLTEKTYKGKSEASRKDWRCPTCRAEQCSISSEDGNSDTDIKVILASIKQSLECLPALKVTVEKMEQAIGFMSDN